MFGGVHLTLMMGPVVAVPVSPYVLETLTDIQVTNSTDGRSGFQMNFNLSPHSSRHLDFILSKGGVFPLNRVIIVATVNGTPEVLMDGVVTRHEVNPGSAGSPATLSLTGEDLSRVMDYIDFSGFPFPAMPSEAQVALILAKYAVLGIVPLIIPSPFIDLPLPVDRIPVQEGKDLAYIQSLADDVGYVFYIDPGPVPGMNIAYWGPELKISAPQAALNVDMDAHTNVESLSFSYDGDGKKIPVVYIQNPTIKFPIPIPIPDLTPFSPPLGAIPAIPRDIEPVRDTAKYTTIRGLLSGMATAAKSSQVISAGGSLDVARYGRILKARRLVGVRGAGEAYDGLYYVKSVTHSIKPGEYKQNFTLTRNGLTSLVSKVTP